jgi:hypothetical protein
LASGLDCLGDVLNNGSRLIQETASGISEKDFATVPFKQLDTEFIFQVTNMPTDWRLCNAQASRRLGKVQFFCYRNE